MVYPHVLLVFHFCSKQRRPTDDAELEIQVYRQKDTNHKLPSALIFGLGIRWSLGISLVFGEVSTNNPNGGWSTKVSEGSKQVPEKQVYTVQTAGSTSILLLSSLLLDKLVNCLLVKLYCSR